MSGAWYIWSTVDTQTHKTHSNVCSVFSWICAVPQINCICGVSDGQPVSVWIPGNTHRHWETNECNCGNWKCEQFSLQKCKNQIAKNSTKTRSFRISRQEMYRWRHKPNTDLFVSLMRSAGTGHLLLSLNFVISSVVQFRWLWDCAGHCWEWQRETRNKTNRFGCAKCMGELCGNCEKLVVRLLSRAPNILFNMKMRKTIEIVATLS